MSIRRQAEFERERRDATTKNEHFHTFFGRIYENSIIFCIDTSGSMHGTLEKVKEHLIELLLQLSTGEIKYFNLIEFSNQIVQWSDKMVACTQQTVSVAIPWIQNLKSKTGTNTLEALLTAFGDAECEAVYLVTDSVPDQETNDVIDDVIYSARNRQMHCFFIQHEHSDPTAIEFLKELAIATNGSLNIVVCRGTVEEVIPVYQAVEMIHTNEGNIFPSNSKMCTVKATLQHNNLFTYIPIHSTWIPNDNVYLNNIVVPPHPFNLYPWPYRHYYFYASPEDTLTRYYPTKSWLKHAKDFVESIIYVSPDAGIMLIGVKILARRLDGYFYSGTVKSQILNNKFLVELHPSKHGKYQATEYQETYVHDMVSLTDALRHPILVQDKVLAPWEPEGERYAPGIVIDGQEKRIANDGDQDQQLLVMFFDGKTINVVKDKAVWIPNELYDRIWFEWNLPTEMKKEYRANHLEKCYGMLDRKNLRKCSYSEKIKSNDNLTEKIEDEQTIPYTDITKSQLNNKVLSQIANNNTKLDKHINKENIVNKKEESKSEAKSILEIEEVRKHDSPTDSHETNTEANSECKNMEESVAKSLLKYKKISFASKDKKPLAIKQQWKYWKNESSPDILEPKHFGPYRAGPYKECVEGPSVLLQDIKSNCYGVEWTSPLSHVVDTFAKYKGNPSVLESFEKQREISGSKIGQQLGFFPRNRQEELTEARRNFRQKQILEREISWQKRIVDNDLNNQLKENYRRQQHQLQIEKSQIQNEVDHRKMLNQLESKQGARELQMQKINQKLSTLEEKEVQKLAFKSARREHRLIEEAEKKYALEKKAENHQMAKELKNIIRTEQVQERFAKEACQNIDTLTEKQQLQSKHVAHLRHQEQKLQNRQNVLNDIKDENRLLYRAKLLV